MEVHLGGDLKGGKTQRSWPGAGSQAEGKGRAEYPRRQTEGRKTFPPRLTPALDLSPAAPTAPGASWRRSWGAAGRPGGHPVLV